MALPSPEFLNKILRCDPAVGRLWWRERPLETFEDGAYNAERLCSTWNAQWAGKEALATNHGNGYKSGGIGGKKVFAHRAIWALVHGEWADELDHINGIRSDNRLVNLRSVTRLENNRNRRIGRNNTSGAIGVCWDESKRRWTAYIGNGHLGTFKDFDAAIAVRKEAERDMGYHKGHGR